MLLYITNHDPAVKSGGNLVTRAYIEAFSAVFDKKIDLCAAAHCEVQELFSSRVRNIFYIKERPLPLKLLGGLFGILHRHHSAVKRLIKKNDYSHVVFDSSLIAGSLVRHIQKKNIQCITIHHNFEPDYFWDNKKDVIASFLLLQHVKRLERRAYRYSDFNFFLTKYDMDKFKKVYRISGGPNVHTGAFFHQGQSFAAINRRKPSSDHPTFVLSGAFQYRQTEASLAVFFTRYYKFLPEKSEIIAAGRNPSKKLTAMLEKYMNVTLVKNPEDMSAVLMQGDVYICPVHLGGGIKIRCMEAFASGLPVIAHTVSSRGYEEMAANNFLFSYGDEESFIKAVHSAFDLIKENGIQDKISSLFYDLFSFQAGTEKISGALKPANHA